MSEVPTDAGALPLHGFIAQQFLDLVRNPGFPCTTARGSAAQDRIGVHMYGDMRGPSVATPPLADLYAFIGDQPAAAPGFRSFADTTLMDEAGFKSALWTLLQRLHGLDRPTHPWDLSVSADPASPDFSFSLGGRAFFLVGLHPGASRHTRRFAYPAIIFNAHAQFEALRTRGAYGTVRERIRKNDLALQGSINPTLRDHGAASEAMQCSGRQVEDNWACPFRPMAEAA